jgi:hypothetical protein
LQIIAASDAPRYAYAVSFASLRSASLASLRSAVRLLLTTLAFAGLLGSTALAQPGTPKPAIAESPTIKVLVGLTVPEFEQEMRNFQQALGVNCNFCHVPKDFANEQNARKQVARKHLEMTLSINKQYFTDTFPPNPDSKLGTVTCMTCHQGEQKPKQGPVLR